MKNTQRIRDELVDGSKVTARKHERIDGEVPMDRKLNQDDGVTEQSVNQSGTVENGSEHAACQVKVQEKVVTSGGQRSIGKIKVKFTAVVARDARRCLLSGTQLRTKGYTFSLNQRESFLTQPKDGQRITMSREGNRGHTQSCLSVETKRDTVGNLPDVETCVGKCETRIAESQDWSA